MSRSERFSRAAAGLLRALVAACMAFVALLTLCAPSVLARSTGARIAPSRESSQRQLLLAGAGALRAGDVRPVPLGSDPIRKLDFVVPDGAARGAQPQGRRMNFREYRFDPTSSMRFRAIVDHLDARIATPSNQSSVRAGTRNQGYDPPSSSTTRLEFVATNTIGEVNTGVNKIYTSVDPVTGEIQYVGRTNDIARRGAEHLRGKGIQIQEVPGLGNLSVADARAVEQVLIEANGGPGGGQLLNKINSIAKSNPDYAAAIKRGCAILSTVGKSGMGSGVC